jgi:imidazolonepropionase-like amidohydrolase
VSSMLRPGSVRGLLLAALAACAAPSSAPDPPPRAAPAADLAIVGATVLPMDRDGELPDTTVLVAGGRIVAVGPAAELAVPEGAQVIDGHGRFLMPGLVDMHVHCWFSTDLTLFVANGVTTIRNMFGAPLHVGWRDEIAAGRTFGPTIVTAGPIVDGDPPVWPGSRVVKTPEDARAAVAENVEGRYDFVKVYVGVPADAYAALIEAARAAGQDVCGHVPRAVGLRAALAAGQHTIEHLDGFERELAPTPSDNASAFGQLLIDWSNADLSRLPPLVQAVKDSGSFQCPTLVVLQKVIGPDELERELARPEMRYVPPMMMSMWKGRAAQGAKAAELAHAGDAARLATTRALAAAGVPVLLGTDMGNPWVLAGWGVHEELANLVAAGLTPAAALRAATRTPAECLHATGEFGAVAPGLRADLLLLADDPTRDIANASHRVGVVLRGSWHPEADLQQRLEAVPAQIASGATAP